MKKFILWLIRVFKLDIPAEKIIEKEITVEKEVYLPTSGTIDGDIIVKGNVTVTGTLTADGDVSCYGSNELWKESLKKEVKNGSI